MLNISAEAAYRWLFGESAYTRGALSGGVCNLLLATGVMPYRRRRGVWRRGVRAA